jgi:hypothetical protein
VAGEAVDVRGFHPLRQKLPVPLEINRRAIYGVMQTDIKIPCCINPNRKTEEKEMDEEIVVVYDKNESSFRYRTRFAFHKVGFTLMTQDSTLVEDLHEGDAVSIELVQGRYKVTKLGPGQHLPERLDVAEMQLKQAKRDLEAGIRTYNNLKPLSREMSPEDQAKLLERRREIQKLQLTIEKMEREQQILRKLQPPRIQ